MISTNITDYDPASLRFSNASDVFENIRHPEDGEWLIGESFYVTAEAPNGVRWHRQIDVLSYEVVTDDEGDIGVKASGHHSIMEQKALTVAATLEAKQSPRLNPEVWVYAGAGYGSQAYQGLGLEEEQAAWERESERWG